ncbi:MAG: exosortase A [Sphingomonadales bacterium]|nr:exosortase A [Sphingomonadales bacterium]
MLPDLALRRTRGFTQELDPVWQAGLTRLGLACLGLIAAFAGDWARIFDQWWNSSTYNHMLLVPLMVGWLIWQRRDEVLRLRPLCWWPGLGAVLPLLLVWVLGALSGFDLLRQGAVVALLPASVLVMLGPKVFAALLFPLAFMVFMVPFGDEFVAALQMITAALTIALVKLSGIPASIDGVFIDTPAGLFEVAEACSGVKFLIAMIALGVFVAHVGFRSWPRRAAFLALCVVAPVLANGVRAFGTILAAQYVGVERAGGIDHLIYGWVFFALVIAGVLGLAWRWFDRPSDDPMVDAATIERSPLLTGLEVYAMPTWGAALALAGPIALALTWASAAERMAAALPAQIALPEVPGWSRVDYAPGFPWNPRAAGADHRLLGRYRDREGRQVDVFYALYSAQREGKEAGGFGEGALRPDSGWAWQGDGAPAVDAKSDRLRARQGTERLAETYYRIGGLLTGSNARLKLATIRDGLLLTPRPTALLILSSEVRAGHSAEDDLATFRRAVVRVGPWMDRIGPGR